jgi:hypothetical protein
MRKFKNKFLLFKNFNKEIKKNREADLRNRIIKAVEKTIPTQKKEKTTPGSLTLSKAIK